MWCERADDCRFFDCTVGYSPELTKLMRERFCERNPTPCARARAAAYVGWDAVPADMLPTDGDRLETVTSQAR